MFLSGLAPLTAQLTIEYPLAKVLDFPIYIA